MKKNGKQSCYYVWRKASHGSDVGISYKSDIARANGKHGNDA